jgi:anti-sigma B factor antagonist
VETVSATMGFDIRTELDGRVVVVSLSGEMDVYSAAKLRNELNRVFSEGKVHVVLDLTELEFMDSTGLGVMARASRRAQEAGGELVLRSPQRPLQKVLEITGMHRVFTVVE